MLLVFLTGIAQHYGEHSFGSNRHAKVLCDFVGLALEVFYPCHLVLKATLLLGGME